MAKKIRKIKKDLAEQKMSVSSEILNNYARDFLTLRKAIIDNCKDCIRDCGHDCLDGNAKPLENIRCPLQKVRIDYGIAISEKKDLQEWRQEKKDNDELQ
jgi:hypothetical protein